jgi:thioredoxin reductase (NADPH)
MEKTTYDLVVVGAGPAGLTAGIYAARAKLDVLILEKAAPGGQILMTDWIENYPGFPEGLSGADLIMKMTDQVKNFGVTIETDEVTSLDLSGPDKTLALSGRTITAKTVIIASGASPKKLGVPGEDQFLGRGVSTCATCDAPFFKNSVVAAVGGGNTAIQESLFLSRFVSKLYLVHRRRELRADKLLQERAFENEKIQVLWNSKVTGIKGSNAGVESITIENVVTGKVVDLPVEGCFIWVGTVPNTSFLENSLNLDEGGFIEANQRMETSVPGVYAVGDVRSTPLRQVATAVGDAAIAASMAAEYIEMQ